MALGEDVSEINITKEKQIWISYTVLRFIISTTYINCVFERVIFERVFEWRFRIIYIFISRQLRCRLYCFKRIQALILPKSCVIHAYNGHTWGLGALNTHSLISFGRLGCPTLTFFRLPGWRALPWRVRSWSSTWRWAARPSSSSSWVSRRRRRYCPITSSAKTLIRGELIPLLPGPSQSFDLPFCSLKKTAENIVW